MKKVYAFLAQGYEEVEALTAIDLLRRAGIETVIVSVTDSLEVVSSHNVCIKADIMFDDIVEEADMLMLPGGMPGTTNLAAHQGLAKLIMEYYEKGKYLSAICAAPIVYGGLGLLDGRKATCYPGNETGLEKAEYLLDNVVVDGQFITSRGLGTAIDFGLKLVEILVDKGTANNLSKQIIYTIIT